MANPMLDKEFLKQLDQIPLKEVYAEIFVLNDKDEVLESIEGRVTQGTVNIDGASSVRRTCSLTIAANELNIHEYYWGLHTRFKLALGVRNNINPKYPDIIWFKQGIFVISSFTTSQSTNSYTISIQGKDKMTRLNGEFGGMITSLTHDFGTVLEIDEFGYQKEVKLKLKDIITSAVHQFANEPMYNIIVNDLDDTGLELLQYRGEEPLFIRYNENTQEPENFMKAGEKLYNIRKKREMEIDSEGLLYNPLFKLDTELTLDYDKWLIDEHSTDVVYSIAQIPFSTPAGYRITDLTYAGDLILNIGETVTAMLDKIVTMLGDYEYFYDIDGRFIFQRKKTYMNNSLTGIKNSEGETYVDSVAQTSAISYSFEDGTLISSYSNNPNYPNIRNDFSVWGVRKSITGQELPVHMRFAIDEKPWLYVSYDGIYYTTETKETLIQRLQEEFDTSGIFYIKKESPYEALNDWWDIFDWAEYYKTCVGTYPNDRLNKYCTSKEGGRFMEADMYAMFPKGDRTGSNPRFVTGTNIFDVEADGTVGYSGHGISCSHYYEDYFLNGLKARGATAYIYKPQMPIELSEFSKKVSSIKAKTSLEWRELIYQMAQDYNKNHLKEDFSLTIEQNNFNRFRKGITGYEQYYTDLDGFWRELYDPDYEFHYENVSVNQKEYEEYCDSQMNQGTDSEFKYFYSRSYYKQCTADMPFSKDTIYYTEQINEEKHIKEIKAVSITAEEYASNKTKYYIIPADKPTEIVNAIITEPYHRSKGEGLGSGDDYYKKIEGVYQPYGRLVPEDEYYMSESPDGLESNRKPTDLAKSLYQIKSYNYYPCFEVEPYQEGGQGYFKENGDPYETVQEKDYTKSPKDYYLKDYNYYQCNEDMPFISGKTYYYKGSASTTDEEYFNEIKIITEGTYEKDEDKYYLRLNEIIHPEGSYNSAEVYYRILPTEITFADKKEYDEYVNKFELYRKDGDNRYYQCAKEEFVNEAQYYTIQLEAREDLLKRDFNKNKTKYYRQTDVTYNKVPETAAFDSDILYYSETITPVNGLLGQDYFNSNKSKYYTKEIKNYAQCTPEAEYDSTMIYYLNLLTKDSTISETNFPVNDLWQAERGYVPCTNQIYKNGITYYKKQGDYQSCAGFNMTYNPQLTYYYGREPGIPTTAKPKDEWFANVGPGEQYAPVISTANKPFTETEFNHKDNKPYIYIYRPLYENCEVNDVPYNSETKYYTRTAGEGGGSSRSNQGAASGGGKNKDDNHSLYTYNIVGDLDETTYNANRTLYFIRVENYAPQIGLAKSEFDKNKSKYYVYTTTCRPCGQLAACAENATFQENLVYYKKDENNKYSAVTVTAESFAEDRASLYYGVALTGVSYIAGLTYYIIQNGNYVAVNKLSKADYEKDVSKYYYKYCSKCLTDDIYASDVEYYKYQKHKYEGVTADIFEGIKTQLWYVSETHYVNCQESNATHNPSGTYYYKAYTPLYTLEGFEDNKEYFTLNTATYTQCADYHKCASNTTYNSNTTYYVYNEENQKYEKVEFNSSEQFDAIKENCYTYKKEEFYSGETYYIKIDDNTYMPKSVLSEPEYNRDKALYWVVRDIGSLRRCVTIIREYTPGATYVERVFYKQCDETSVYDKTITYYTKNDAGEYEKVSNMTEQKFNEDKLKLHIMLIEKVYDIVEDVNVDNYEEKALDANLYHKYENYEPCVHPVAYSPSVLFYLKATDLYSNKWHKDVSGNPALLNFWFDFLDGDHELQKFSCHAIGNRPKGVNDNQVKAIYFRETPTVVFVKSNDEKEKRSKLGYTTIQIPDEYEAMFDISSQGKSAKAAVDNLLYQHACVAEQISISVLPIYHLEPNTRIFIRNDESGINGEYILVRYNITLGTNGNMSITAAKAVDKLY